MYHGCALGRLLDTVYFTHSHHAGNLADVLVFLAGRYGRINPTAVRPVWHERRSDLPRKRSDRAADRCRADIDVAAIDREAPADLLGRARHGRLAVDIAALFDRRRK